MMKNQRTTLETFHEMLQALEISEVEYKKPMSMSD